MKSSIIALVIFGLLLTFVQCRSKTAVAEFEIQQGLLSGGRSYSIKSLRTSGPKFSIHNELFSIGKKLVLSEEGKARYTVKHNILNLMSTWTITDATDGKELGTIKNKVKLIGSKIVAKGAFGHFTIKGNFGNHSFRILRDNVKVAKIEKERFHIHDTYGVKVYGDADPALMVLFAIIVDEIREH